MCHPPSAFAWLRPVFAATLLLCVGPLPADAKPDFSRSRISITPAKPAEGEKGPVATNVTQIGS